MATKTEKPKPATGTERHAFRTRPPELWKEAITKARENGETVTEVLNRALEEYVDSDES